MSHISSKPSGERGHPSPNPTSSTATQRPVTQPTIRKRSYTKIQPPAIHLSLKTSSSALSSTHLHGGTSVDYGVQRATFRNPKRSPSASPSTASPSTGRSAGYSPSSLGTNKSASPLTASPDRQSLLYDSVSSSLPVTLSALPSEPSLELFHPSPPAVSRMRRPSTQEASLSPYRHGSPHSLSQSRSANSLRGAATRLVNDPASRKTSAASIERNAGLHLDMKRLLSKPVPASHSGSSIASAASDSEAPKSPTTLSYLARKSSMQRLASPKERTVVRRATDDATSPSSTSSALRKPPSRNILKRKPSTARSNSATPTAQTFQQAQTTLRSSSKTTTPDSSRPGSSRRTTSATALPVSLASLRRHQSPPADLTPAGAVAHAYKQQEQHREALAEASGGNEQMGKSKAGASRRAKSSNSPSHAQEEENEEGSGVYYTVFGGTAGRVVAVGSAEDSDYDLGYDSRFCTFPKAEGEHVSAVRSLSRKVSGRFKRSESGGMSRDHSPYAGALKQVDEPFDGRVETSSVKAPGHSIDGYVEIKSQVSAGTEIPSVQNGTPERKDGQRGLRSMRSFVAKDTEGKERAADGSPGGKLWKLMKRISTGALRDKYHDTTPPPPVPALPDNFKHLAPSRTTFEIRKGRDDSSETGITRFMQSRASLSGVRPSTAPQRSTPRSEHIGSRPSTGPRPSTTTRSSSPMSSDIASSKFFRKSHSNNSSISSYGEQLPPLPGVGQQIMPPGELYKELSTSLEEGQQKKQTRQRTRSRTRSIGGAEESRSNNDARPGLPPPRRSNTAVGKPVAEHESDPPSPLIPAFDTSEPTNNFATLSSRYSLPTSEFGVLHESAPPRPKRSSRRKPPPFDIVSPTASTPTSPLPITPRTPRSPNVPSINVDFRNLDRKSIAGSSLHSTIHESSHSASPSSATTSHFRSPLRFREMDPSPRTQLSEREKAAKWNDLLMRSEQAGGTLHIGESGLMSDNIRFSEYSSLES